MNEYSLHFSTQEKYAANRYRLMELPKELVQLVEGGTQHHITIRGRGDDDAVLCTADKTYSVRAVMVSNSFCVLTPPLEGEAGDAIIRDSVRQIYELTPSIAKLHRLRGLLRGCEYDDESDYQVRDRRWLEDVKSELQASDAEFEAGLRDMRILVLNGELRPITPSHLNTVLELILNTLVSESLFLDAASVIDIVETLQSDHEIPADVAKQVMSWFGTFKSPTSPAEMWTIDADSVVRQLGIGILSAYRSTPVDHDEFMKKWRTLAGDTFESRIDISLLRGNFIQARQSATANSALSYFPSSELPVSPVDRFAELFLVQSKWRAADITPFLDDIAIDSKERDKLLMKFARAVTDNEGVTWYTARGAAIA